MSQSFKSRVLNLYNANNEGDHFRIEPDDTKVLFKYMNGLDYKEVQMMNLTVEDGVNVKAKMDENAQNLIDEEVRALAKETEIETNLSNEESRAVAEEARIQSELDAEKLRVSLQETNEAQDLANEQLARETADLALDTKITNEANLRQAADTAHTQAIVDEENARILAITTVENTHNAYVLSNDQRVLDAEIAHADYVASNNLAVGDLNTELTDQKAKQQADHDQEVLDRTNAVANLQSQIDFFTSNSDPASIDSLTEIVNKFNADGQGYADRLSNLESVVQELVEQLTN